MKYEFIEDLHNEFITTDKECTHQIIISHQLSMKKKCYLKKRLLRMLYSEYDIGLTDQLNMSMQKLKHSKC